MAIASVPLAPTPPPLRRSLEPYARRDVLWIGGRVPKRLTAALMVQHSIVPVPADAAAVDAAAPHARALLIEVAPEMKDVAWAGPIVDVALDHELRVLFTTPEFEDDHSDSDVQARYHCSSVTRSLLSGGRVTGLYSNWSEIAQVVDRYDPKGGCNRLLHVGGEPLSDASAETLVRRAFQDLEGISLELIQGGKSGAAVWIARPSVADLRRRSVPFLVKWNTLDKIRQERSNVMQHACNTVPFSLTPPLHPSRCVEGSATAILVFDFIDRAIPFAVAIQNFPAGQLIGSLFDHTLAGCLVAATDVNASLVHPYETNGVLRWTDEVRAAMVKAQAVSGAVLSCEALQDLLRNLPAMPHRVATAHGDMHGLNLLVATGSSDVYLIDFGRIMPNMPVVTDAAGLEVSLTFPTNDARGKLGRCAPSDDDEWLEQAYAYPMDPHAVPRRDDGQRWLADAVRAIRGEARQHDPSAPAYAVAVVAYLVRYASYPDNGSAEDRALAYRLASRLAVSMAVAVGSVGAP